MSLSGFLCRIFTTNASFDFPPFAAGLRRRRSG